MGTNQGFKSLVPSDRVLAPFLYWWLKSHTALLQSKGRGATFLELSKAEVERLQIPLPPLPEQRRIAAILDEAAALRATWGETRESARRAISSRISALLSKSTDIKPLAQLLAEPMRNGISPSRGGRYEGEVLTLSAITRGAFDPRQRKSDLFAAPHAADKLASEGLHLICRGNGNAELVGAMVAVTEQLDGGSNHQRNLQGQSAESVLDHGPGAPTRGSRADCGARCRTNQTRLAAGSRSR